MGKGATLNYSFRSRFIHEWYNCVLEAHLFLLRPFLTKKPNASPPIPIFGPAKTKKHDISTTTTPTHRTERVEIDVPHFFTAPLASNFDRASWPTFKKLSASRPLRPRKKKKKHHDNRRVNYSPVATQPSPTPEAVRGRRHDVYSTTHPRRQPQKHTSQPQNPPETTTEVSRMRHLEFPIDPTRQTPRTRTFQSDGPKWNVNCGRERRNVSTSTTASDKAYLDEARRRLALKGIVPKVGAIFFVFFFFY